MARRPTTYRHHGVALLRASTDPGGLELPGDLALDDLSEHARALRWINATWQREQVQAAITHASPALAAQIEQLRDADDPAPEHVRRAGLSLASYLLRWSGRATPFGMFAGTAFVRTAPCASVTWTGKHTYAARVDAAWLSRTISELEQQPSILERVPVVAHSAASIRAGRCVIPGPPVEHADLDRAPVEVSTRLTPPVRAVLESASTPRSYRFVRAQVAARFPAAPRERIDALLCELIAAGFLLTGLRAPATEPDPLGHLSNALIQARTRPVEQISRMQEAIEYGTAPPDSLMINTALDGEIALPDAVLEEASEAAELLCRLSPHPVGYPAWRDYHRRFRSTYGTGALVPLLELVGDAGLGYPAGYLASAYERAPRQLAPRDEAILELVQRTQLEAGSEIDLTPAVIADLAAAGEIMYPPRTEICVEVRATCVGELVRGAFQLTITGAPRPGSSMAGRFAHLLEADDREQLAATYVAHDEEALTAQLSFAPRKRSNENLTRTSELLPHVISLGEHRPPGPNVILPADLAVTADARSLYLIHAPTGRVIEPRVTHALQAGVQTPPLARLLSELTTARCAVYKAFDFGAAARLPHLPRVRYRRTVLAPARWLLHVKDLPGRAASTREWENAFGVWRNRWQVPQHVAICEDDRRLPLDLDHRTHRLVLRTRLAARAQIELREAVEPEQLGWIGRAHELLIPLTLTRPARPAPATLTLRSEPRFPGTGSVLHARIHAHPTRYDELLTDHLPLLTAFLPGLERWWFNRHREMARPEADQHLSIYLRLTHPAAYGDAAASVSTFAQGLERAGIAAGLTLASYQPQTGRYGYGPAADAAEEVFAADTDAALAQITSARSEGVHRQALAAAGMLSIITALADSEREARTWLLEQLPRTGERLPGSLREQAFALTDPVDGAAALAALPHGEQLGTAWRERSAALHRYRETVAAQRNPLDVARTLLHQHHVRAVRVDPATERVTERLARATALSLTRRQEH
ncbi:lantibiotic dehydratase [Actinospica robiniae]|uniref:lantibiotic dehydratase n=1 Tax=Actinospica robiniae TaxID=304901 RepID=UPI0003F81AD1|nr:lantibiotic dehydratase [Actinospica robiniae]